MTEADIHAHCATLPGAERVIQWEGARVWKLGGKVFAIVSGSGDRVTLKCADPETATFLIEIGAATRAPYLPRGGWVSLPVADTGTDELAARLTTSYVTVRKSLPRATRDALPAFAG